MKPAGWPCISHFLLGSRKKEAALTTSKYLAKKTACKFKESTEISTDSQGHLPPPQIIKRSSALTYYSMGTTYNKMQAIFWEWHLGLSFWIGGWQRTSVEDKYVIIYFGTSCSWRWDPPPSFWTSRRALKPSPADWLGAPMGPRYNGGGCGVIEKIPSL